MGGLFKAPKPVVVTASAPVAAAPAVASPADVAATAQAARVENQERAKRGLAGTVATSDRGVLQEAPRPAAAARKTLLGE
jgi:hypothetical protein